MIGRVLLYEGLRQLHENGERWSAYQQARAMADALGKPLLNVGCPRIFPGKYPCGDVCLDISPERLAHCQSPEPVLADVRDIPYPDAWFGAALCSHVLEHLPTVEDALQALRELRRVAGGRVYVVSPSRLSLAAWLHPEHRLWVEQLPEGSIRIQQR